MRKTVLGIFSTEEDATDALAELQDAGYRTRDISIVMKDSRAAQDFARDTGTTVADSTVSGAVTGGVIGGLAGLLIGIGAIAIPGIGAVLIGGPLAAALGATGAAATTVSGATTGLLAGGLIGALIGLGVPQETASAYEERIRHGGVLIAVPAQEGSQQEVEDILDDNGAQHIQTIEAALPSESVDEEEVAGVSDMPYGYGYGAKGGKSTQKRKRAKRSRER